MTAFASTAADIAPIVLGLAAIAAAAWVGIKTADRIADRRDARAAERRRAARVAADTWAREQRQAALDDWTRRTRSEFEKAMVGRPFLAATRAESEARGLDDEWARIQQNGWAS